LNRAEILFSQNITNKEERKRKGRFIREIKVHTRTYIHTYRKVERLAANKSKVQTIMMGNEVTQGIKRTYI
jgi:hypothetical protein